MELQPIQSKIYEIRGQRVMLDFDLAELYQVETKRLKEAVRRNIERFEGDDFMFVLSEKEYEILRTQIATSSLAASAKSVLKLGWSSLYAICFYGNGCRNAFERPA